MAHEVSISGETNAGNRNEETTTSILFQRTVPKLLVNMMASHLYLICLSGKPLPSIIQH